MSTALTWSVRAWRRAQCSTHHRQEPGFAAVQCSPTGPSEASAKRALDSSDTVSGLCVCAPHGRPLVGSIRPAQKGGCESVRSARIRGRMPPSGSPHDHHSVRSDRGWGGECPHIANCPAWPSHLTLCDFRVHAGGFRLVRPGGRVWPLAVRAGLRGPWAPLAAVGWWDGPTRATGAGFPRWRVVGPSASGGLGPRLRPWAKVRRRDRRSRRPSSGGARWCVGRRGRWPRRARRADRR